MIVVANHKSGDGDGTRLQFTTYIRAFIQRVYFFASNSWKSLTSAAGSGFGSELFSVTVPNGPSVVRGFTKGGFGYSLRFTFGDVSLFANTCVLLQQPTGPEYVAILDAHTSGCVLQKHAHTF